MLSGKHWYPSMAKRSLACLLFLCAMANGQTSGTSEHWIAVRAGRLFNSTDQLQTNRVILIKGDRIAEVGTAETVRIPEGAEIVDLSRATVLPGLIDAHTH